MEKSNFTVQSERRLNLPSDVLEEILKGKRKRKKKRKGKRKKVPPGFEPGSLDSKSRMITVTTRNQIA